MSARKRARISLRKKAYQSEHAKAMKALFTPQQEEEVASVTSNAAHKALQASEERKQAYHATLETFRQEVKDEEKATGDALISQQAVFCQSLTSEQAARRHSEYRLSNEIRDHSRRLEEKQKAGWDTTRALLEKHISDVERNVLETQRQRQTEVDCRLENMERRVDHLWNASMRRESLAEETLEEADSMLVFIDRAYEHERFFPGEVQELGSLLGDAAGHLSHGAAEAALASAGWVHRRAASLRVRLEAESMIWETLHARALTKARQLYELGKHYRRVKPIGLDGREIEDLPEMHVNFWAEGKLERFLEEMRAIIGELGTAPLEVDTPLLMRVNEETLPGKERELASIVLEGREGVLHAQLRVNIAEIVIQALGGQGYYLDEEAFKEDDQRKGVYARLISYAGDEILVEVKPDTEGENGLELHALTHSWRTAYQLKQSSGAVIGALKQHGLVTGPLETIGEVPDRGIQVRPPREQIILSGEVH